MTPSAAQTVIYLIRQRNASETRGTQTSSLQEMKRAVSPATRIPFQNPSNRESVQTLSSSDTATQYPRREVRSEWVAENKFEIFALEEHQEAMDHRDDFILDEARTQSRRFGYRRVFVGLLLCVFSLAAVAVTMSRRLFYLRRPSFKRFVGSYLCCQRQQMDFFSGLVSLMNKLLSVVNVEGLLPPKVTFAVL